MTVTSGFFNSVSGDRTYDAEDMGNVFNGIIEDGVHKGVGSDFAVEAKGGLSLGVGDGQSWFDSTWLINDDEITITAADSHVALPRIDAIVLEMDRSSAVRQGSIKFVEGVANATPVPPTMTHTSTVNQYPVATITRAAGSTVILQSHITNLVGTPQCPYAVSKLLDRSFEPSWMHRNVFRGKNLGSTFTPEQKANIQNGSFDDLYVGDYWESGGRKFRIADINYFLNKGNYSPGSGGFDDRVTTPHLVIVPDAPLHNGSMYVNASSGNANGYMGSQRSSRLAACRAIIEPIFGDMTTWPVFSEVFSTAVVNGKITATSWVKSRLELLNAPMVTGAPWFDYGPTTNNVVVGNSQLALFRLAPWFIAAEAQTYWLRDVVWTGSFSLISTGGHITYTGATGALGWRPFFLLG